jgi:hypothetical protein
MNLTGMLAGFMRGQGDKAAYQRERAVKEPQEKLAQQLLKLQMQQAQQKLQQQKITQQLLSAYLPMLQAKQGGEAGAPAAGGSPTFNGQVEKAKGAVSGQGLTDQISSMDPLIATLLKSASGIDFPGASNESFDRQHNRTVEQISADRLAETKQQNEFNRNMEIEKYQRGLTEGSYQETWDPEKKAKVKVFVPKYEGGPGRPALQMPKDPMAGETAGKMGMLKSGADDLKAVEAMLLDSDGNLKDGAYKLLTQAAVPGGGMPWTDARRYNSLMLNVLEGKVRIESGAAVPDPEIARVAERFKPSVFDNEQTIKDKLKRMRGYLDGTISMLDPNKKYSGNTIIMEGEDGKKYVWQPHSGPKKMTKEKAIEYLRRTGGDKEKARELAKKDGWTF